MRSYRDLRVWQTAYGLTLDVHRDVAAFPRDARWGLGRQMCDAAISIVSNIAEGSGRRTVGENLNQLSVACGSAFELETQTMLARDLTHYSAEVAATRLDTLDSLSKMLFALMRSLKSREA